MQIGGHSMVAPLGTVIVKRPNHAFRSNSRIRSQWRVLGYSRPPDLERATLQHERFVSILIEFGAEILYLPEDEFTGLDSIYTHDPVLVTDAGALILQGGKAARRGEGKAFEKACAAWSIPVLTALSGQACAEAGDMLWLDPETLLVGRSFRTNTAGILRLRQWLEPQGVTVTAVDLPHWKGPSYK